jgi:hypothetical protein
MRDGPTKRKKFAGPCHNTARFPNKRVSRANKVSRTTQLGANCPNGELPANVAGAVETIPEMHTRDEDNAMNTEHNMTAVDTNELLMVNGGDGKGTLSAGDLEYLARLKAAVDAFIKATPNKING